MPLVADFGIARALTRATDADARQFDDARDGRRALRPT